MSLELQDLPTIKVDQQVHCLLKGEAHVQRIDMNTLVRQILHDWARQKFHAFSMAQDIAKSKGLPGIDGDWK